MFDYDAGARKYEFEAMQTISRYNKNIRVVDIGIDTMQNLNLKIQASLASDEVVAGIIYSGHGSPNYFYLSTMESFNGSTIGTWTGYGLKGIPTAETLNVLLWSCSCGYDSGDTSFQSQFVNALKVTLDDLNKKPIEINIFAHMAITTPNLVEQYTPGIGETGEKIIKKYIALSDSVFRFFDRKFGREAARNAQNFLPYALGALTIAASIAIGQTAMNNFGHITGLTATTLSGILLYTLEYQRGRVLRALHVDNNGHISEKPLNSIENIPKIFANKCELKLQ